MDLLDGTLAHLTWAAEEWGDLRRPGLLLLHGRGSDERDLLQLAPLLDKRFFVVSARAPLPCFPGYMWYDIVDLATPDHAGLVHALDRLDQFSAEILERYPIDPARLYLLGFSQGAAMSALLALTRPERLAAAVLLSGYLPATGATQGMPRLRPEGLADRAVFIAHGTLDPVLPVERGRALRDRFQATPATVTYQEYPIGHEVSLDELNLANAWLTAQLDTARA